MCNVYLYYKYVIIVRAGAANINTALTDYRPRHDCFRDFGQIGTSDPHIRARYLYFFWAAE